MDTVLKTLNSYVEQIKKEFADEDLAVKEYNGSHFAAADIAVKKNNNTSLYRIAVVKYNQERAQ